MKTSKGKPIFDNDNKFITNRVYYWIIIIINKFINLIRVRKATHSTHYP